MKTTQIPAFLTSLLLAAQPARAETSLGDFAQLLGFGAKIYKALDDGTAQSFWLEQATEFSPKMVSRVEMDGICKVRVTTMVQSPGKWGQMQVLTYDFSRMTDFKAFASLDIMASQSPAIAVTEMQAQAGSFYGKALMCVSNYDLRNEPEVYSYCEDRLDLTWFDDADRKAKIMNAMAAIGRDCDLPALRDAL